MIRSSIRLFFLSLFIPAVCTAAWVPAHFSVEAKDKTKLVGVFQKPAAGKPVVICLHGLSSVKEEWEPFAKAMTDKGWGVLAYDARGHGESSLTKDAKGHPDGFQHFGPPRAGSEWLRMIDDVGVMVRYVRLQTGNSLVPIYLAGASVGANVALIYASLTRSIRAAILLSPGLEYVAFRTEEPIKSLTCPVLMVASTADSYAFQSVQKLQSIHPQATVWTDVKPGHGVQMFDDALLTRIATWLEQHK